VTLVRLKSPKVEDNTCKMKAMGNYRDPSESPDEEWGVEGETRELRVDASGHGQRLDKVLAQGVPEFSRSYLRKAIEEGHVLVDSQRVLTPSKKVVAGQRLDVQLMPTAESLAFRAEALDLDVVFVDQHIMVINKAAGMVVHPGAGNWSGTLLNGLLHRHADAVALPRAGIVHRLDKDTTGLMVVGRSLQAVTALTRQIAAREVHREYLALAHGHLQADQEIQAPVGRDPRLRTRMAVHSSGKPARTDVYVMAHSGDVSAVRCILHTGRTHQIRVHLSHLGYPLVGDEVYGGRRALGMNRQALHAWKLSFDHPLTGRALQFAQVPPADFVQAWRQIAPPPWASSHPPG